MTDLNVVPQRMRELFPGLLLLAVFLLGLPGRAGAEVTVYPAPDGYPASGRFRVTVDGQESHVYNAEVAADQEFQRWPHPVKRETVGFTYFEMDGPATVRVRVQGEAPRSARVRPLSKDVRARLDGDVVTVHLPGPGNYVVELNHDPYDHLYLFANAPETEGVRPDGPNVKYFGPGVHEVGRLEVERDGQTIYIAGGAVVKGCIWANGVDGLRVAGRGLLVGTDLRRGWSVIWPRECTNVRIEDITILDSQCWTIKLNACRRVRIEDVRQISYVQNSDGIDPCSCEDVEIEGVFIRSYDDGVVVKTMRGDTPSRDIRTRGSTFITDHGTSLKIGNNETLGPPISEVVFQDCDVLSCRGTPLGLFFNGPSCVSDVRFENIRVEESRLNPMMVRQDGGEATPRFIYCNISTGNVHLSNYTPGYLRHVTFRDVRYTMGQRGRQPSIRLRGHSEASSVADVALENIQIDGRPVTGPEHPAVVIGENVFNVHFKAGRREGVKTARRRTAPLPEPKQPPKPPLPPREPTVTGSGDILIEAETGELGPAMNLWSNHPKASDGWYVMPAERSNAQGGPPGADGHARYEFSLDEPAAYRLQARVLSRTDADNSFWVRVDDGRWVEWRAMPVTETWEWCDVRDAGKNHEVVELDLSAGTHEIVFAYREDGTKLDRIGLRRR